MAGRQQLDRSTCEFDCKHRRSAFTNCTRALGASRRWQLYTWGELTAELIPYVKETRYTHIELLPVPSIRSTPRGLPGVGYYAPTARFGSPDDFRALSMPAPG